MNEINFLNRFLFIANKLNSSALIITKEFASSVNEEQTLFITVEPAHIHLTSFSSLATRDRIGTLYQRMTMFDAPTTTFKVTDTGEVEDINISSKRNKINFKCMKKSVVLGQEKTFKDIAQGTRPRPPKKITAPPHCKITMTPEEFASLEQLAKTIDTELLLLNSDETVSIILSSDTTGEKGKIELEQDALLISNNTSTLFAHRYNLKEFIKTFKSFFETKTDNIEFIICSNGFLTFVLDDAFNITMVSRKVVL